VLPGLPAFPNSPLRAAVEKGRARKLFQFFLQFTGLFAQLSKRPAMLGQSNPTSAARELSLWASSSAGMAAETPDNTEAFFSDFPWAFFLCLDRFPVADNLGRSVRFHVSENMGMAVDQFAREPPNHVVDRKPTLFLRHLGVKEDLQQKIAEFPRQLRPIPFINRLEDLIGLLEGVGLDGIEGLFAGPRGSPPARVDGP